MIGCFRLALIGIASQPIRRAADTPPAAVQNMGVDHGRADVLVAQEFLHRADVVTIGQQMRGKRMPKRVPRHALRQSGLSHSLLDRLLDE